MTPALERLFAPRGIALVGMPGDLDRPGARPLHALRRHGYRGAIHPVNPRRTEIGGLPTYSRLSDVPRPVDVAWIGVPAAQATEAVRECGRAGIPFAIVLGAGFAEIGGDGEVEQARLRAAGRDAGVRIVGPNTVGFVNAWDRVALTFSTVAEMPALLPGAVALLSQSGGLGGCLLNQAVDRGTGLGLFVSTGNEADLGLADYLAWLVDDGRARAVACLVEQVRDPDRFAAAVRRALAAGVAVVVQKLGGSEAGQRTARSHTASLVGGRDAWRAWARTIGLLEVDDPAQLVETAGLCAAWPRLGGGRAAMVTSSGGVAVLLADALEPQGYRFDPLSPETVRRLRDLLPPYATAGNPLDITAGLPDETFGRVLEAVVGDPAVDLVVVPLTMATADGGRARARAVVAACRTATKPVAVYWPGGSLVAGGLRTLADARVPLFHSVGSCATALGALLALRGPSGADVTRREPPEPAGGGLAPARFLPWDSVRDLLVEAGLPVVDELVVRSESEATRLAARLVFPVAVKLLGPVHKSEVGGVRLGVEGPAALLDAVRDLLGLGEGCLVQPMVGGIEVLVGALRDPALGPFVVVAPGGIHAELFGERAMRPAPVDPKEADRMLAECPGLDGLLRGHRGRPPANRDALADVVTRVAALAVRLGSGLASLDLNPVMAGTDRALVVDARIALGAGS
jgi:acyl-CoA synthetase (NDP forming)